MKIFAKIKRLLDSPKRFDEMYARLLNKYNSMDARLWEMSRSVEKSQVAMSVLIGKQERMRTFIASVETAGVRRKFGGVIEVNFDKFLDVIGPSDEKELGEVIKARKGGTVSALKRKRR